MRWLEPNKLYPLVILFLVPILVLLSFPLQNSFGLSDFNIGAAGDYACTGNAVNVINGIKSKNPELVLGLGDYSYQPTATCWFNENSPVDGITKIAIGNHEDDDNEDYSNYISHYKLSNPYYSFNLNNVHVLVMDSDRTSYASGSAQYNFVLSDLQAASSDPSINWIIVTFHRPIYTSPNGCSSCDPPTALRNYHVIFDTYGVDLVLQGHVHDYQRTYPLKYNPNSPSNPTRTSSSSNSYNNPEGEIYAIVGTGGNNFHSLNGKSSFVVSQQDTKFGYMDIKITNNGGTLEAKYYLDNGAISDQFTITKTITNPPSYHYDPSFTASGSNYHEVASSANLQLPKFTLAAWFKTSKTYTAEGIIATKGGIGSDSAGQNNNYGLWMTTSQKISGGFETSSGADNYVTSPATYNNGQWHYGVVSYDGTIVRLYVDGAQVGTLSTSASPETSGTLPLRVGANSRSIDRFFTGSIDEVRVWNRALSSQEVTDTSNGNFNTQGQVLYLPFGTGNSPPVANNQAVSTPKNTAKAITLTASDPDSNPLTFTVLKLPMHGALTGNAPSLTYTPVTDFTGPDSFIFKANDGTIDSNNATVSISVVQSDNTPPTVVSTIPANSATGVATNSIVTANFSEPVQSTTVSTSTFTLKTGNTNVPGSVTLSPDGKKATFSPSSLLAASTTYNATVTTGVKDLAGNALASNKVWSFTTAAQSDNTPPTVTSKTPADGATGVAVSSSVTATFSEALQSTTVTGTTFALKPTGGASISGTVTYDAPTKTATFKPAAALVAGTPYTATLTNGIKDLAGNSLVTTSWSFTTAAQSSSCDSNLPVNGATSSGSQSSFPPTNAIDNNLNTKWYSTFIVNPWINLDLGSSKSICSVDIAWADGRQYSFFISVSIDGTTFNTVFTGMSSGATSSPQKYSFSESNARFVKITITQSQTGSSSIAQISEIDIFGKATSSSSSSFSSSSSSSSFNKLSSTESLSRAEGNQSSSTSSTSSTSSASNLTGTGKKLLSSSSNINNHPPIAKDDRLNTEINKPIKAAILKNDEDPDGDNLRIVSVLSPTPKGGSITINDNNGAGSTTVIYTPPVDFAGSDSFTYVISDNKGATNEAIVKIAIRGVDEQNLDNDKKGPSSLDKNTGALREDKSTNISNADNVMPVADAGPDLIAREGTAVLLDGGNSFDKDGKIISYKWEQTNGPKVLLTHPDQEKASFLTPTILQDSVLGFKLTVSDNAGSDSSDRVNIMILNGTREK